MDRARFAFVYSIVVGLAFLAFVIVACKVIVGPAFAHDAIPTASQPLGWTYDYSCCNTMDCREVKDTAVKVDSKGYTIVATGEVIAYQSYQIKRSKDEYYHRCSVGGEEMSRTLCLYVPDRGF